MTYEIACEELRNVMTDVESRIGHGTWNHGGDVTYYVSDKMLHHRLWNSLYVIRDHLPGSASPDAATEEKEEKR